MDIVKKFLERIRREPVFAVTVVVAVGITAFKVWGPERMPISEVFTQDYLEYVMLTAGGVVARVYVTPTAKLPDKG